jgi:hypothetical protein
VAGSIAFIDESGDLGRRPGRGSSAAFVLAMVVFEEKAEAERCRQRIEALRAELGKAPGHEFHFTSDGHATRLAFLRAVREHAFKYYATGWLKQPDGVPSAVRLYGAACAELCKAAQPYLDAGSIVIDGGGTRNQRQKVVASIRHEVALALPAGALRDIRVRDSGSDDLLQLADYIAAIHNRLIEQKRGGEEYRRLIVRHQGADFRIH